MPKIKCASCECKWNNDKSMCTYKGMLLMNDCDVMTVHDGRQHFHRCKMYEESEEYKELKQEFLVYLKEVDHE